MSGGNYVTLGPIPDLQNDSLSRASFGLGNVTGQATIVPAVTGKRIFVHSMTFLPFNPGGGNCQGSFVEVTQAGATVTYQLGSNTYAPVFLINQLTTFPYNQYPWFTCASGNALAYIPAGGVTVSVAGMVQYVQG